jgi:hypothetical protein
LLFGWALGFASVTSSVPALADRADPSFLLGGDAPIPKPTIVTDPRLPTGAAFATRDRPSASSRVCSLSRPVCAHADAAVSHGTLLAALDALELAFARLTDGLGLPPPLGDQGRGGSDHFDMYLSPPDRTTPGFERVRTFPDTPRPGGFDRASGFCSALADEGALLERAAALCVGEAIALALDPAETPHLRRAFATELWWTVGLPTSFDFEAIHHIQQRPTRALAARELSADSEGSAILFDYLEAKLGAGEPGTLSASLFSASVQTTAADAVTWRNEPDVFDVLRHTLDESEPRMAELLGDLAVRRAFMGVRDDGDHWPELAWSGDYGAVHIDWDIAWKTLPRRVRVTPTEPNGAVMVRLDLAGMPAGVPLGFQAEWEPPARFQWTLVRLGSDGIELGRLVVPFQSRETAVEARLVNLADTKVVLAVGTHIEHVDVQQPFDPDVAPFEPHAALVYLVEL